MTKHTVYELIVTRETRDGSETKSWGYWQDKADLEAFASRQFEYDERFSWVVKPRVVNALVFKAAQEPWGVR